MFGRVCVYSRTGSQLRVRDREREREVRTREAPKSVDRGRGLKPD